MKRGETWWVCSTPLTMWEGQLSSPGPRSRGNSADSELISSEMEGGLPFTRGLPLNSPRVLATAVPFHAAPVLSHASLSAPPPTSVIEIQKEVSSEDIRMAALYVDAALHGRKFAGFHSDDTKRSSLRAYRVLHSDTWRLVYIISCLVHVVLACFERPSMLASTAAQHRGIVSAAVLEWLCIAVYAIDLFMYSLSIASFSAFWRQHWRKARLVIVLCMAVDALIAISGHTYRFSRGMRPFMLVFRLRNLRKVFAACLSTMRRAAIIFFLVAFLILLFGFVGHALMGEVVSNGDLSSVTSAFYQLLLLQTTMAVFGGLTQPYYKLSRWTAFYFVVYSIVGNLLLLKMIIAVGYDSYRTYMKAKIAKHIAMRDTALETAFRLLDSGCGITFPHWQHMCKVLGRPDDLTARVLYHTVRSENAETVTLEEFAELCLRINAKAVAIPDVTVDSQLRFKFEMSRLRLQRWLRQTVTVWHTELVYFDVAMSVVVACSLACIVSTMAEQRLHGFVSIRTSTFSLLLTVAFITEIMVKLYAYGPERYWKDGVRRLDVLVTLCDLVDVCVFGYSHRVYSSTPARYWFHIFNAIKALRLMKAFAAIQIGVVLSRTMVRIFPAISNILTIIGAVGYALALVGMEWYSGWGPHALVPDNPHLANNAAWQALAAVFAFRDLGDSFLTVFEVAIVGNWFVVMDAARDTSGSGSGITASLYFFVIRIVMGMLLLPVFFGFVIEAFNNNLPVVQSEHRARRAALLRELAELQRAASVARMPLPREVPASEAGIHEPLLSPHSHSRRHPAPNGVFDRLQSYGPAPPVEGASHTISGRSVSTLPRSSSSNGSETTRYVLKRRPNASDVHQTMFGLGKPGGAGAPCACACSAQLSVAQQEVQRLKEALNAVKSGKCID